MKKALLVGTIESAANDISDMIAALAPHGFGCQALTGPAAPKSAIVAAMRSLIAQAVPGDSIVLLLDGHGFRTPDTSGDEADGYDEGFAPYDFSATKYLLDDEIAAIIAGVKTGVKFDVFHEFCYAGDSTKSSRPGENLAVGSIQLTVPEHSPYPIRHGPGNATKNKYSRISVGSGRKHCLWAACAPSQMSWGCTVNGVPRGLFMYFICRGLREFPAYTRTQLMTWVRQQVAIYAPDQVPQLEATTTEANQLPFG
jgi:hypothetical protein